MHQKLQKYAEKEFSEHFVCQKLQNSKINQNTNRERYETITIFSKYDNLDVIWFWHFLKNSTTFCTTSV